MSVKERNTKGFNPTRETIITENNESYFSKIQNTEAAVEQNIKTVTVFEQFLISKACVNCNKHIIQNSFQYISKCVFCTYTVGRDESKLSVIVKLVIFTCAFRDENSKSNCTCFIC